MHGLIREEFVTSSISTKDIARHLYIRVLCGTVVIVTDNPDAFLPALRKQWLKLMRKVQRERSSTLNSMRTYELTDIIAKMQNLRFSTNWSSDVEPADVYIATIDQLLEWPPDCRTMYVTCRAELEQLHLITTWMPKGGLAVTYKLSTKGLNQHES